MNIRYDTIEEALQAFKAERYDILDRTLEVHVGTLSLFIRNMRASDGVGILLGVFEYTTCTHKDMWELDQAWIEL
jgi:hypothetical protein